MSDRETQEIVEVQQRVSARLLELGFGNGERERSLVHHLAEISVLSRNFAEHTLPLFLTISPDHDDAIARLAVSIKCDLDEIRDAINDVQVDLIELMKFLNTGRD